MEMYLPSSYTGERHTITYRICGSYRPDAVRVVDVHASREEMEQLSDSGYLVRERLFTPEQVRTLRDALDEVVAREIGDRAVEVGSSRRFGGLFLRHLMDKHPAFLALFRFQSTLSIARAALGPQVQVLPMTARISYPDQPNQETQWHFHQRVSPDPMPVFFARPHVIDCLIYLDDANEANGMLCIVPGSHHRVHDELSMDDYSTKPGQVELSLPAGSCVLVHGGLWHRALPTTARGTIRRLLILPYAAAWLKLPSFGVKPQAGLLSAMQTGADAETLELLGVPDGLY